MINSINESEVLVLLTLNIDILSLKYQGDRHRGLAEFVMIQFLTEISSDSRTIPNFFIQLFRSPPETFAKYFARNPCFLTSDLFRQSNF